MKGIGQIAQMSGADKGVGALMSQAIGADASQGVQAISSAMTGNMGPLLEQGVARSEEHTSELQSPCNLVCRLLLEKKKITCYETSFHRGHSAVAELVPLPHELFKSGIERYGFHGISYQYITSVLPKFAPEISNACV